jgi:aminoglycoside phosphotransferase (APT) family kinase protein
MHADELDIDVDLVARLIAGEFPQWAGLPLEPVLPWGTDNAIFRLGHDLAVRLPRTPRTVGQAEKDRQWLPRLAPHLPAATPEVVAIAPPSDGFGFSWAVYRWLEGEQLSPENADRVLLARDLAAFVTALQAIDCAGGPPGRSRGVPLRVRDAHVRAALESLRGEVDVPLVTALWEQSLRARDWERPPLWLHGDLMPGNLLVRDGRLAAVIDFSLLCVGDPATDVMAAWQCLTPESRPVFREALDVDDATWLRGRGWALSSALLALPYYRDTNPPFVRVARNTLAQVLADAGVDREVA